VTALGIGMVEGSYTKYLDQRGLEGARIGILRESIGVQSEPESEDFKKVDAVFEKNVAELKAAGDRRESLLADRNSREVRRERGANASRGGR